MKKILKAVTPNAELNIVEIARVSSSRKDKSEDYEGLVNYLIKNNHWSPFEHAMMTIEIVTTKAIGIQLLRHRSFTFQEFSQRYAKINKIEDIELRLQAETNRQSSTDVIGTVFFDKHQTEVIDENEENEKLIKKVYENLLETSKLYIELIDKGVAKECARMIMPMATSTTIFMSGTIRSWIHLLDIRDDSHAQKEVQLIAKEMKKIFIEQCPIIAAARGWV